MVNYLPGFLYVPYGTPFGTHKNAAAVWQKVLVHTKIVCKTSNLIIWNLNYIPKVKVSFLVLRKYLGQTIADV